jgi:hypothetical protein
LLRNPNKVATPAKTLAEVNVDLVAHDGTLSKKTPERRTIKRILY